MADAETLLHGGNRVIVATVGDVRLDLVRAGNSVDITSSAGAILDNTRAETDLIYTDTLTLSALKGIGVPWKDNLNVNARIINASNAGSVGINLQNRTSFTVGKLGISNTGTGDIVLTSGGAIYQNGISYRLGAGSAGIVSNRPGQRIYMLGNLSSIDFEEQFGNNTAQSMSTLMAADLRRFNPSELFQSWIKSAEISTQEKSAFERMLELESEKSENALEIQPIRIAGALQLRGERSILNALGLSEPKPRSVNPPSSALMPAIEALRVEPEGRNSMRDGESNYVPLGSNEGGGQTADAPQETTPPQAALRASLQRIFDLADDDLDASMIGAAFAPRNALEESTATTG
jgi:hypothetical protein